MDNNFDIVKKSEYRVSSKYFDVAKTLECGQCFRWQKDENAYVGVVAQSVLVLEGVDADNHLVTVYGNDMSYAEVVRYFDLETDYELIMNHLSRLDAHMEKAAHYGAGIRILKQEPFETLMSFILSSNNNIPKIRMTVEALSEKFGIYLGHYKGQPFYTFPSMAALTSASIEALNVKAIGYRAKSIFNTCAAIKEAGYNLNEPFNMAYNPARAWLTQFYGVGDKVADCVMLFAYGKLESFPIDTWVKKMLGQLYGVHAGYEAFVREKFVDYPGVAQQVLFYYIRNLKN